MKIVSFPSNGVIYNEGGLLMMYYHTVIYFPEKKIWKIHKHSLKHKILEDEIYNLTPLELFCYGIFDISYENGSFCILKDYLLITIVFLFVKYPIDGGTLNCLSVKYLSLKSAIMENSRNCKNWFRLFYNWRIKSSKNFPRNHAVPGLFF